MKKIRFLFQGDSITDAGRDRRDFHDLGSGYPKFAADLMCATHPEVEFDFINLGISGNRTSELFDRFYRDGISLQPDVISILIGINDIWHRYAPSYIATTDAQLELNYSELLKRIKRETNAKIIIMAPYILDAERAQHLKKELSTVNEIIKRLAKEYADAYVPLDELFETAVNTQPHALYYSADGVHPNENGAKFIGECLANAVEKIIN